MSTHVKFLICFLLVSFDNKGTCDTLETTDDRENDIFSTVPTVASGDIPVQRSTMDLVCDNIIHQCPNDHKCQRLDNDFVCIHPNCAADQCNNNGYCVGVSPGAELECVCNDGFSGGDCSATQFDRCSTDPNPCDEGLECKMDGNHVECLSTESKSDVCSPNTCENGGTCVVLQDDIVGCECTVGFEGNLCQQPSQMLVSVANMGEDSQIDKGLTGINRCEIPPSPCEDDLKCKFVNGRVVCYREPKSHCAGVTCNDRGSCLEVQDGYRCVCRFGFEGNDCEKIISTVASPCDPDPCQGDCTCKESCQHEYGYYCISKGGFMGKNCTIPVPKVACGQKSILIDIPEALYVEFDKGMRNTYMYLSQDSKLRNKECETVNVGGKFRVLIPLPFTFCESRRVRSKDDIVVKNRVFINHRSTSFDMAIPILDFECTYEKEYTLVTSLKPVVSQPNEIDSTGSFIPEVGLCKVASCPNSCPEKFQIRSGAVYTIGEMIHLSATVLPAVGFDNYVTTIDRMELSCTADSHDNELFLVENGCRSAPGFAITSSSDRRACFSFQTPRALACKQVYIHLSLVMCRSQALENCAGNEMKRCSDMRVRRSIKNSTAIPVRFVTIGPLIFINGKKGTRKMSLYPEASSSTDKVIYSGDSWIVQNQGSSTSHSVSVSEPKNLMYMLLAIPALLCVLFALLSLALFGSNWVRSRLIRTPLFRSFAAGDEKQEILEESVVSECGDANTTVCLSDISSTSCNKDSCINSGCSDHKDNCDCFRMS